jgi:hypothetical protein
MDFLFVLFFTHTPVFPVEEFFFSFIKTIINIALQDNLVIYSLKNFLIARKGMKRVFHMHFSGIKLSLKSSIANNFEEI